MQDLDRRPCLARGRATPSEGGSPRGRGATVPGGHLVRLPLDLAGTRPTSAPLFLSARWRRRSCF